VAELYRALGYDVKGYVCLMSAELLDGLEANYTNENIDCIKAWTLVNTLLSFTNYFDRETYEAAAKFQEPLTGTGDVKDDDAYALEVMDAVVPTMLDQMYVNYCFNKEIKPQVAELTRMMIDAYREMINEEDWLADETKAGALEKLDNFKMNICYPDRLPEIGSITIGTAEEGETVFSAVLKGRKFLNKVEANALNLKNDGTYWRYDNYYSTLVACYIAEENSINIYAGICGGDYYDPDWPLEKKLGGLCMVVGHEITHAFDTKGSQYDKDGNKKNWWTEEDRKAFQERVNKLVQFYSALVPMPQVSDKPYGESGAMVIMGEAIADLGSLKCLLSIAKKQEHFDYDLFFRQLAVNQKQARYEAAERAYVATDPHPIEAYRCNIPVQNYDEFLETYGVKEGDGMYLAPEDRIRVW
jgi:putative endopeptidase